MHKVKRKKDYTLDHAHIAILLGQAYVQSIHSSIRQVYTVCDVIYMSFLPVIYLTLFYLEKYGGGCLSPRFEF